MPLDIKRGINRLTANFFRFKESCLNTKTYTHVIGQRTLLVHCMDIHSLSLINDFDRGEDAKCCCYFWQFDDCIYQWIKVLQRYTNHYTLNWFNNLTIHSFSFFSAEIIKRVISLTNGQIKDIFGVCVTFNWNAGTC